jgi:CHAT domain-containing protein
VLVSLWDVDDRSTATFMTAFYGHLIAEKDIALAMQMTVREMRERYPAPYQWAPFLVIGKTELC